MFKKKIVILFSLIVIFSGCDILIPEYKKDVLPPDHSVNLKTAYHKPGYEYPFGYDITKGEANCASARCHHSDLKGGIAKVNNVDKISPSCYQCHGVLWKEIDTAFIRSQGVKQGHRKVEPQNFEFMSKKFE